MRTETAWHAFALAFILYPALLWHYIRANAPVFDEGEHIAAGYRYWRVEQPATASSAASTAGRFRARDVDWVVLRPVS
ncbi:MAG: hypothetical protein ABSH46_12470 [Bryobacteraceae bacterium]|jgi:hypothetical protein